MYEFVSHSEYETKVFGEKLAALLEPGDVITLEGDLGAGKTTFTKGLAKGLGIERNVNSPTFTLIKEYRGNLPLYHMDVYRLEDAEDLGFEEYFHSNGVTVVEWASRIQEQLPEDRLSIVIKRTGEESRLIHLVPSGKRFDVLCKELSS
jgi:tRNA threonylcarbamoyladenosine biosynthesis protein TsaE